MKTTKRGRCLITNTCLTSDARLFSGTCLVLLHKWQATDTRIALCDMAIYKNPVRELRGCFILYCFSLVILRHLYDVPIAEYTTLLDAAFETVVVFCLFFFP